MSRLQPCLLVRFTAGMPAPPGTLWNIGAAIAAANGRADVAWPSLAAVTDVCAAGAAVSWRG